MKKENRNLSEESLRTKKHPVRQKFMAILLCICLLLVSLPIEFYSFKVIAKEQCRKIISFNELPEKIQQQLVESGTLMSELELPESLTAVCISIENEGSIEKNNLNIDFSPEGKGITVEEKKPEQIGSFQKYLNESMNEGPQEETPEEIPETSENNNDMPSIEETAEFLGEEESKDNSVEEENASVVVPDANEPDAGIGTGTEEIIDISGKTEHSGDEIRDENMLPETIQIEGIKWTSEPIYKNEVAGNYIFQPVLPEGYLLEEGLELPKIYVTVEGKKHIRERELEKEIKTLEDGKIEELVVSEPEYLESSSAPGCGVISEDTEWTEDVTLENGELIVESGVTLIINGQITIKGNVIIQGGGTIERGNSNAVINVPANTSLTMKDITLDGKGISSGRSMIDVRIATITLDDGCRIQNCKVGGSGGALYFIDATGIFNDIVIENCSSGNCGGAIYARNSLLTINDGVYRSNRTTSLRVENSACGGGFIFNAASRLYIYGGHFIENSTVGRGGAIYHNGDERTRTYIYGGVFQGNSSSWEEYKGSGAIWNSAIDTGKNVLDISGNVKFCGDGTDSGVDGIYLDSRNSTPRKVYISNTLSYPITLYFKAIEGYVIAEGINEYILLHERDMKKINFVDISGSGKKFYAVLDEKTNQVKVSEHDPGYGYYVYYISNGAEGTVVDDNRYEIGKTAIVKPANNLTRKGYTFQEWNTQENGKGTGYQPDDELEIKGDTDLYAIFLENEKREFVANFYSGSTCNKETYSEVTDKEEKSVTTVAKEPQGMEGWNFIGWEEDNPSGYGGAIQPDSEIVLTKDRTEYYGIYQKEITLSYMAEGIDNIPVEEKNTYFANVSNQISYKKKEFTIAPALTRDGYTFAGWNTKPDGTGDAYEAGSKQTFMEDTTLYAVFLENGKKEFMSDFYSGGEGQKETVRNVVEESETSVEIIAPELKELPGWMSLGWCKDASAYQENIVSGSKIGQNTEHASYYGIYRKNVVLSYDANGGENGPIPEEKVCYANVHGEITYDLPEFTIAPALTRDGYTFTGWNTKPDGTGDAYEAGSKETFMEDTVLYAMFLENGKKEFTADFYSGGENLKETIKNVLDESEESVGITVPELKELPGWVSLGWNMDESSYTESIASGSNVEQTTEHASFYGIYRQKIILSYDANGGEHVPVQEEKFSYANVHGEITYELPEFTIAPAITRTGYDFMGWNTKADGSGEDFKAGSIQKIDSSLVLYAVWEENHDVAYKVEHYKQDLEGDGYTMDDAATETFFEKQGTEVEAKAKDYVGFAVNLSHSLGKPKGTVKADGSLVLKLYYDRDVYEVDFNLNGGYGKTPDTQKIRYGGFLKTVESPNRAGYHFKGWHLDDNGLDGGLWDFKSPVENNTGTLHTTLYAKWVDELAPVMGKASFLTGHKDFLDWIIHKNSIIIMVPVVEEGSGLATAEYLLVAEDGTEKEGMAQIEEKHSLSDKTLAYGSSATMIRAIQAKTEQGAYETRIPIEEEFKGKVYLTCKDFAGNVSAQKELTAAGGGVIIEDNAPEISFSNTKEKIEKPINIKVTVKDDIENNVSGGIASITYQLDKKEKVSLPEKDFNQRIVESYKFAVKVSGIGKHTLRINAVDNAGNESEAKINLEITGKKETMVPVEEFPDSPNKPRGIEPKTGDNSHVKIYATVAMIAGFSYLLLYFQGENGITEQEKEEIVYRLVSWAKRGGTIRRMLGLAAIFFFLAYYHSIGKSVTVEWREVYKYQR